MTSTDTDVISDPNVTILTSSNPYMLLVFSIDDVENLLWDSSRIDWFKDDIVSSRFLNVNDIDYSVIVSNLEWENLLTKLAIELFELYDYLAPVHFHCTFGL